MTLRESWFPSRAADLMAATGTFLPGQVRRTTGWVFLATLLTACATPQLQPTLPPPGPTLQFPNQPAIAPRRPNGQIAQDILDLNFQLESGQSLPGLSRFGAPITLRVTGPVPPIAAADLSRLITRLQREAGLDLRLITDAPGSPTDLAANITVEFAPQAVLQGIDPTAACFVAPNVASLAEYRMRRGSDALDWQTLRQRQKLTVFIPSDTSPQEQRDCLHEEVAQALGPLNDLFRLPDSIFNDDNFLSTLTGFDMLVLRVHYDPELAAGMTRDQVAARLPAILARLNPAGERPGLWDHPDTPRDWAQAVRTALGADSVQSARLPAARKMLAIAEANGWQDARLGLSHFALGRLQDRDQARLSFQAAAKVFAPLPDGGVRLAQTLLQLAVLDLAAGRTDSAIDLTQTALPLAKTARNAVLITNLSLLQAEALDRMGQTAAATALRLDTLPAARYGFGSARSASSPGP
jgi:hypothetical protein